MHKDANRKLAPLLAHSGWLARWLDPEWLLFEAFLLVPALVCLLWGDADRAVFYARLALHVGCLKWLGWSVLTRVSDRQQFPFLLFPVRAGRWIDRCDHLVLRP